MKGVPETVRAARRRRLLRMAGVAVGVVGATVVAVYGWAWSSTGESTIARALVWRDSDVDDQYRFPTRRVSTSARPSSLPAGGHRDGVLDTGASGQDLEALLRETDTLAFLVVHDHRLVHERYYGGAGRHRLQTSFSVAKSFLSTLVGIAIDEGRIGSVEDPVTTYVPELAQRDPRFARVRLRDLLTMSSGIRYWQTDLPWPWADDTYTYYGTDLREVALNRTQVDTPPGRQRVYNNYNPLLLGLVLERATGMSVSRYMSTRLWQPLGASRDATWSLDSEHSGFEKLESGINAAAVDYARFGLLHLDGGKANGTRIVSQQWVRAATENDTKTDPEAFYQYFWWVDVERPGRFYALGDRGQFVYVAPDADAVIVRLGRDWGVSHDSWLTTLRRVADRLRRPGNL